MRPEHDVAGNSPRLADQHLWSAEDEMATEIELSQFLGNLVWLLKPKLAVETGCYRGYTSYCIANQMAGYGGRFVCCDPDTSAAARAWGWLSREVKTGNWNVKACRSDRIKPEIEGCDFLFSDSDPKVRPEEVSWLKPGAIAVVHDTYVYPELGEFVKSQGGILFDTPRGFGMIRK